MPSQSYSAGKFLLEIEGQAAGYLSSVEGGEPFASVVAEPADAKGVVRKSPGPVAYEPIRVSFGNGMGLPLYRWMADVLAGGQTAKSGAILFINYNGSEQSRLEFTNGLITELTFPELDAASKNPARFSLTLRAETTRVSKASAGGKGPAAATKKQKAWLLQNFRLKLDDLPTSKVTKIDAITVTQAVTEERGRVTLPPVDIPNIAFTVREADASEFFDWFDEFVIKGNSSKERSGTLEFLDPTVKNALFTLTLSNVGVIRIHRERNEQGAEVIARVRVTAYCEAMAFSSNDDVDAAAVSALSRFDDGSLIGRRWATGTATLEELEQIAALESREWTAIRLDSGHSLIAQLTGDGVVPPGDDGPLELDRDGFVEGIVAGASQVLRSAAPHLGGTSREK